MGIRQSTEAPPGPRESAAFVYCLRGIGSMTYGFAVVIAAPAWAWGLCLIWVVVMTGFAAWDCC